MHASRPSPTEYAPYFERYVSLVAEDDFVSLFSQQPSELHARLVPLSPERAGFRYAPGKWSIREVVGHIIDAERVFAYRALCIARGEATSLPSFDENAYAALAEHELCSLLELLDEFALARQSHVAMFRHLGPAAWERTGVVNQNSTSVRALAYIMAGHAHHHARILDERYAAAFAS
jgi:uncharacterized damage-inducible protein DinB